MKTTQNENTRNIISIFDGISCSQIACKELGIEYSDYFASEISEPALAVVKTRFPKTIQLGDIKNVKAEDLPKDCWLWSMGSPCTQLSNINPKSRHEGYGLEGFESNLLYTAAKLMNQIKPRWWILENVASMAHSERDKISELMGCLPVLINSSNCAGTSQNRSRYY